MKGQNYEQASTQSSGVTQALAMALTQALWSYTHTLREAWDSQGEGGFHWLSCVTQCVTAPALQAAASTHNSSVDRSSWGGLNGACFATTIIRKETMLDARIHLLPPFDLVHGHMI